MPRGIPKVKFEKKCPYCDRTLHNKGAYTNHVKKCKLIREKAISEGIGTPKPKVKVEDKPEMHTEPVKTETGTPEKLPEVSKGEPNIIEPENIVTAEDELSAIEGARAVKAEHDKKELEKQKVEEAQKKAKEERKRAKDLEEAAMQKPTPKVEEGEGFNFDTVINIVLILCMGYIIYRFATKRKKPPEKPQAPTPTEPVKTPNSYYVEKSALP